MGEGTAAERDAAACVERGHGPVLVLVHGSASDRRTWEAQLEGFAETHRVVCCSRRHHWPNAPAPDDGRYSMAEQLEDLRSLVQSLGAGPVHLVGHSYGALLCLLLAVRRPELVRSLVLIEPPAWSLYVSDPPRPSELLRLVVSRPRTATALVAFGVRGLAPARRAARRGDLDRAIRVFGRAVLGEAAFRGLSERRWRQVLDNNLRAEYLTADYLPLPARDLGRVRVPVLLVTGRRSPRMFHRLADGLQEVLPRCRRVDVPGASHLVHEDSAPAFGAAVREFLREAGTAP